MSTTSSTPDTQAPHVIVVGAGIGGLTTAWRLHTRGVRVTLLEATDRVGGAIRSVKEGGWQIEVGPNTVPDRAGVISEIIDELGLNDARITANHGANRRYIVRDGAMTELPMSPPALLQTKLWSTSGKLRMFAEPFIPQGDAPERGVDESLASFVRRRLGDEVLEYAVDPFISGTYAGSPRQLSAKLTLGALVDMEERGGSIVRGAIKKMRRARKHRGDSPRKRLELVNFEGGLQLLPDTITEKLGDEVVHRNTRVTAISRTTDGWHVQAERDGTPCEWEADAVVLATPAHAIPHMNLRDLDDQPIDASCFDEITYPPISVVYFGFHAEQIRHPLDGFGVLIPACEQMNTLGAIFGSTVFPGRTPEGHVMIACFIGGAREPERALLPEDERVALALADLQQLVGVDGDPVFLHVGAWEKSIPQYEVGYGRILDRISAIEQQHPGLRFTGNYMRGISVSDTIAHGARVAREVRNRALMARD